MIVVSQSTSLQSFKTATETASCPAGEEASDHFSITTFVKLQAVASMIDEHGFPTYISLLPEKKTELRYGENPHQKAALYH